MKTLDTRERKPVAARWPGRWAGLMQPQPNISPFTWVVAPVSGDPNNVQSVGFDGNDHIHIRVIFSQPVDPRTVNGNTVVVSDYHGGIVLPGTITPLVRPDVLRDTIFDYISNDPIDFRQFGGWMAIRLDAAITDTRGLPLDGNNDGFAGDDFVLPFTIPFV